MTVRVPTWVLFHAPIAAALVGGVVSAAALAWASHQRRTDLPTA